MHANVVNQARPRRPTSAPTGGRPSPFEARGIVQRATSCACGGTCPRCTAKPDIGTMRADGAPQARLAVGAVDDPLEHEADRVADQIMRMPASAPSIRGAAAHEAAGLEAPAIVQQSLGTPGQPLDPAARAFFEPRFGRDFSAVRIHADGTAAAASRSILARAFTLGSDIAFADGQYDPARPAGRALLAHELAHVVQQSGGGRTVQRGLFDDPMKAIEDAMKQGEEELTERLIALGNAPLGPPSGYTGPPASNCPPTFCQPFVDKNLAFADLVWAGPVILAGIAKYVDSRVVPFWATHMAGGSSTQNLTADFGGDFAASVTTAKTTRFLVDAVRRDVESARAVLASAGSPVTIDFTPRLSTELQAIDTLGAGPEMAFIAPGDVCGNLAGRIGKDQTTVQIGAMPSQQDDAREAVVTATLTDNSDGSLTVVPAIEFTVRDTIDLCPGDCGAPGEQVATIPLSRFEATGISGDVPFVVQFSAPASELVPFTIAPPPSPVQGP